MIPEGTYTDCQPKTMEFGVNKKGNEECVVTFDVPGQGSITSWLYFNQTKNAERSVESLKYCGCTFPDGDITSPVGFGSKKVTLVIVHEEYNGQVKAKVKYINSGSYASANALKEGAKKAFSERMRALVISADDSDDAPF